jgi:hypothetical protein
MGSKGFPSVSVFIYGHSTFAYRPGKTSRTVLKMIVPGMAQKVVDRTERLGNRQCHILGSGAT